MKTKTRTLKVPKYWKPWPHQVEAWKLYMSNKYKYLFFLWPRQSGKDVTCLELSENKGFKNPGSTSCYLGLDNVWINENMFKKRIEGRTPWADYEDCDINVNSTNKEITLRNPATPPEVADSRIKFIGFLNDQQLIGSSYDYWYVSESGLYKPNAFLYIQPIWEQQEARGQLSSIVFNGTPRGIKNNYYDLMRTYTGMDDPKQFPGEHGDCYVHKKTIQDIVIPDGKGGFRPLYTEEKLEKLKDRIKRQYGNLNYYYQEYECEFTAVNAGLVYQGIEKLSNEGRYCPMNLDTSKPVYTAWDISSKGKMTDATTCVVFQYINNRMIIYDYLEERGKSLVECVSMLASKPYFGNIRIGALPWDSERSASSETPIEECKKQFPSISWHALSKERVDRGINLVREQLPNMIINSDRCDRLYDAFMNYEYKFIESAGDWAAQPKHNWASHGMDALRYAAMLLGEMNYLHMNDDGSKVIHAPYYGRKGAEWKAKRGLTQLDWLKEQAQNGKKYARSLDII